MFNGSYREDTARANRPYPHQVATVATCGPCLTGPCSTGETTGLVHSTSQEKARQATVARHAVTILLEGPRQAWRLIIVICWFPGFRQRLPSLPKNDRKHGQRTHRVSPPPAQYCICANTEQQSQ
jgi:hypothetical protein